MTIEQFWRAKEYVDRIESVKSEIEELHGFICELQGYGKVDVDIPKIKMHRAFMFNAISKMLFSEIKDLERVVEDLEEKLRKI